MNKVTGALLFALPLTVRLVELRVTAMIVCAIATIAAVQEGYLIRTGNERRDEVYAREIGGGKSE
jgi:CDP-diacylglycerol--glycerol-3-phosphate 3-phosphatidyltransferase